MAGRTARFLDRDSRLPSLACGTWKMAHSPDWRQVTEAPCTRVKASGR
jgi:hypothetical protein